MTPFRSQRCATAFARQMVERQRAVGRCAELVLETAWPIDSPAWRRTLRRPQLHWLVARPTS
jgi:hypothetical protein